MNKQMSTYPKASAKPIWEQVAEIGRKAYGLDTLPPSEAPEVEQRPQYLSSAGLWCVVGALVVVAALLIAVAASRLV
jgi:hypothetical protein